MDRTWPSELLFQSQRLEKQITITVSIFFFLNVLKYLGVGFSKE